MERKPIRIKSDRQWAANQEAVRAKLIGNIVNGSRAFNSGDVTTFSGYSEENFTHEAQARIELTAGTMEEIRNRITRPLYEVALTHGVKLLTAGEHLEPAHITLQPVKFNEKATSEQVQDTANNLFASSKFGLLNKALSGRSIALDTLFWSSNGSIALAASNSVAETFKARQLVKQLLAKGGSESSTTDQEEPFSIVDFDNITHATIARIAGSNRNGAMSNFFNAARKLNLDLSKNPIAAGIQNVRYGTTYNFVNEAAPYLFKGTQI